MQQILNDEADKNEHTFEEWTHIEEWTYIFIASSHMSVFIIIIRPYLKI